MPKPPSSSRLSERVKPQELLTDLFSDFAGPIGAEFLGLAIQSQSEDVYEVVASIDCRRDGKMKRNRRFTRSDTAAAWVQQTQIPFIGSSLKDVRRFRQTATDMAAHGFSSNIVAPVEMSSVRPAILYCMSRRRDAFSLDSLAVFARIQRVVVPLTQAWAALCDLEEGEPHAITKDPGGLDSELSLAEVERLHISAVLDRSNGMIEGQRGAAVRLGLKPSTLRSKMQKLGIR